MAESFTIKLHNGQGVKESKLACEERYLLVELREKLKALKTSFTSVEVYKKGQSRPLFKLTPKFLSAPLIISIIGTGYVGLVTGVGLCHRGRKVICVDVDQKKVEMINQRETPIYEKGLQEMLSSLPSRQFTCTTDMKEAVLKSDATFIAVGTPPMDNGDQCLDHIRAVSIELGKILKHKPGHLVVVKSTVIPGTTQNLVKRLITENAGHSKFRVAMVPEFLREGLALEDFLNPARIIIGVENNEDFEDIKFIFKEFKTSFFKTAVAAAEMIKYASNAMLATKITFANEIGNICKHQDIDVYEVMDGVGLDPRIGRAFLNAGRGFGGRCFPKDVKALMHLGRKIREPATLLEAVWQVNERQPLKLVELAKKRVGILKGKQVAVMGLAFKPGTDDVRESPAIIVIRELLRQGAQVIAYDPVASENMAKVFPNIEYGKTPKNVIDKADVVIGVTEWPELRDGRLYEGKVFIDGMKFLNKKTGKDYEGICW